MALIGLDIPTEPTSGLQNFAIVINFLLPALAFLVVAARVAGRLATHQFGLGTSSPRLLSSSPH